MNIICSITKFAAQKHHGWVYWLPSPWIIGFLAYTLLVGTKGNCGWICSWPCEPCAYLPEVVGSFSWSVGRPEISWYKCGPLPWQCSLGSTRGLSAFVECFVARPWSRVLVAVQSCLMGGGLAINCATVPLRQVSLMTRVLASSGKTTCAFRCALLPYFNFFVHRSHGGWIWSRAWSSAAAVQKKCQTWACSDVCFRSFAAICMPQLNQVLAFNRLGCTFNRFALIWCCCRSSMTAEVFKACATCNWKTAGSDNWKNSPMLCRRKLYLHLGFAPSWSPGSL